MVEIKGCLPGGVMVSRARPARFGSGPVGGRIFALLAVAALLMAGSPGIA